MPTETSLDGHHHKSKLLPPPPPPPPLTPSLVATMFLSLLATAVALLWLLHRATRLLKIPAPTLIQVLGIEIPETPNVSIDSITASTVTLHWSPPEKANSVFRYLLEIDGTRAGESERGETAVTLQNLKSDTPYTLNVLAVNANNYRSNGSNIRIHTRRAEDDQLPSHINSASAKLEDQQSPMLALLANAQLHVLSPSSAGCFRLSMRSIDSGASSTSTMLPSSSASISAASPLTNITSIDSTDRFAQGFSTALNSHPNSTNSSSSNVLSIATEDVLSRMSPGVFQDDTIDENNSNPATDMSSTPMSTATKSAFIIDSLTTEVESIKSEITELRTLASATDTEFSTSETYLLTELNQLRDRKRADDAQRSQIRSETKSLEDTKRSLETRKSKIQRQYDAKQGQFRKMTENQNLWEREIKTARDRINELNALMNDTAERAHDELDARRQNVQTHTAELSEVDEEIKRLVMMIKRAELVKFTTGEVVVSLMAEAPDGPLNVAFLESVLANENVDPAFKQALQDQYHSDTAMDREWALRQKQLETKYVAAFDDYNEARRAHNEVVELLNKILVSGSVVGDPVLNSVNAAMTAAGNNNNNNNNNEDYLFDNGKKTGRRSRSAKKNSSSSTTPPIANRVISSPINAYPLGPGGLMTGGNNNLSNGQFGMHHHSLSQPSSSHLFNRPTSPGIFNTSSGSFFGNNSTTNNNSSSNSLLNRAPETLLNQQQSQMDISNYSDGNDTVSPPLDFLIPSKLFADLEGDFGEGLNSIMNNMDNPQKLQQQQQQQQQQQFGADTPLAASSSGSASAMNIAYNAAKRSSTPDPFRSRHVSNNSGSSLLDFTNNISSPPMPGSPQGMFPYFPRGNESDHQRKVSGHSLNSTPVIAPVPLSSNTPSGPNISANTATSLFFNTRPQNASPSISSALLAGQNQNQNSNNMGSPMSFPQVVRHQPSVSSDLNLSHHHHHIGHHNNNSNHSIMLLPTPIGGNRSRSGSYGSVNSVGNNPFGQSWHSTSGTIGGDIPTNGSNTSLLFNRKPISTAPLNNGNVGVNNHNSSGWSSSLFSDSNPARSNDADIGHHDGESSMNSSSSSSSSSSAAAAAVVAGSVAPPPPPPVPPTTTAPTTTTSGHRFFSKGFGIFGNNNHNHNHHNDGHFGSSLLNSHNDNLAPVTTTTTATPHPLVMVSDSSMFDDDDANPGVYAPTSPLLGRGGNNSKPSQQYLQPFTTSGSGGRDRRGSTNSDTSSRSTNSENGLGGGNGNGNGHLPASPKENLLTKGMKNIIPGRRTSSSGSVNSNASKFNMRKLSIFGRKSQPEDSGDLLKEDFGQVGQATDDSAVVDEE